VVLGFVLRIYRIGNEGLWIDEAFSVWLARHPLAAMVGWVSRVDQHPPLYYALLHGWIRLVGDGEAGVRIFSALCGALTIPVVYLLGRRLVDERMGLVGALILAASPFHVRLSQEARMYTLLTLAAASALYAFVVLLERREGGRDFFGSATDHGSAANMEREAKRSQARKGDAGSPAGSGVKTGDGLWKRTLPWIVYVVSSASAMWTHNAAVLLPIALNLCVVGGVAIQGIRPGTPRALWPSSWLRGWIIAQGAVLLLWLPWFPSFISQAIGVYRRFWLPAPTLGSVVSVVSVLLCDALPLPLPGIVALDGVLLALALLGLTALRRRPPLSAVLGAVFLLPLMAEWFLSLWRPILYARTLVWISIPLILMLATGVCQIGRAFRSRAVFLLALVAVLVVNGGALVNTYHSVEKEAWDEAAALVAERATPDDLILFHDAWGQIPFDYYFSDLYNRPITAHGIPADLFDRGVLEPEMMEKDLPRLRSLVGSRDRVWLVYSHEWYTDPQGLVPSGLRAEMALLNRWEFHGLEIFLFGR
jgi:asparagine N-glycosylation enzyme membrane subunit Stt3